MLPFGELVLTQTQHAESATLDHRLQSQRSLAIWLGRCEATGEHILAKANNTSLVKSRTVTRLSLESSMDLSVFKSISIPPPELTSAASLKMAKPDDPPCDQTSGEGKLMLEFPTSSLHDSLPSRGQEADQVSNSKLSHLLSHPPPGLIDPPVPRACTPEAAPATFTTTSFATPAIPPPVVQQPASAPTALPQQVAQPSAQQPSAEQASQPKPVRRRITQKGPGPAASKLHSILEKARTIQEIELAVNASEEELRDSQEVLKNVHLQAYYEDDLELVPRR